MSDGNGTGSIDLTTLPSIPRGWRWCLPCEVCGVIASGSTPAPNLMHTEREGIPFLKVYNLTHDGHLDFSVKPTFIAKDTHEKRLTRSRVIPGDVLMNIVGPPLGKVSVVPDDYPEWNINQAIVVFRPNSVLSNKYLAYALLTDSILTRLTSKAKATAGQHNIGVSMCRTQLPLPLAPTAEQRRIVAKIEELFSDLDAGVAALERVRANLKRYRASVLKAAVEGRLTEKWRKENPSVEPASKLLQRILTERRKKWEEQQLARFAEAGKTPPKNWRDKYPAPVNHEEEYLPDIPPDWTWLSLGTLAWNVKDGPHYSPPYCEEGIPFITGGHVRPEGIDFSAAKRISPELHCELCKRCKPEYGDLLYTKGGTTGIARINWDRREFSVWVHVAVLKLVNSLDRRYLQHALNSPFCYAQSQKYTHGIGNQDLGLTRMVKIALPLPPLAEQKEIADEVERRLTLIAAIEGDLDHSSKRASRLRQAILKRAFEGKLVPQDPKDEPASVLLGRIKTGKGGEDHDTVQKQKRVKTPVKGARGRQRTLWD